MSDTSSENEAEEYDEVKKEEELEPEPEAVTESDDEYTNEDMSPEEDWSQEEDEDLEATLKNIKSRADANAKPTVTNSNAAKPEAVDKFLRNLLLHEGMALTLDCFQNEWNELVQKGEVEPQNVGVVPEVYTENLRLDSELRYALREREEHRRAATATNRALEKVLRSRDLQRRQHQRLIQEKNRLIDEIKRLKARCDDHDPALNQKNEKYEAIAKQPVKITAPKDKGPGLGKSTQQLATTAQPGRSTLQPATAHPFKST